MSANIKIVFIVVIGVGACLLSIFSNKHFYNNDLNNHLVMSQIDQVAVRVDHIQLLGRSFIQDAEQTIWDQISQTMESVQKNLQAAPHIDERWRQEIEDLDRSLENYHGILTQLYEPAVKLKAQKKALQEIGLAFSLEVEDKIIKPYRKEEGLRIYDGKSIDPFKARAKDAAYDLVAFHIKQQLILLEFLLSSDLESYKQKKQYLSTTLAQHGAQLRYMAVLMGGESNIQSILESLDQKLEMLLSHEHAIIQLFAALAELDGRLKATGDKLLAAGGRLSSKISSDTIRIGRLNRIFNWSLLLGILGGVSVIGALLARNIIQFVEDLRAAKQRIEESEEKYRSFIENSPVAMFTLNSKGEFTYANKKLLEFTGYKNEDWLDKPFHPIVHPEDLEFVKNKIQDRLAGKGTADPYEIRISDAAGKTLWVKINSESIYETDEQGVKKPVGIQSFVENITDRKQAEEALVDSECRFKELFEHMSSGVAIYESPDNGQRFIFRDLNKAGLTNSRRKKYEVIGREVREVFPGIEALGLLDVFKRVWKTGHPEHYPSSMYEDDNLMLWVENYVCKLPSGELVAVYEDTTARKQAEEAKEKLERQIQQAQKMESIGNLAGGIAHDFNNILGIILGNTDLAMDDVPEWNPARLFLEEVRTASLRAKDVVRQLLSFARKTKLEKKPTNIIPVVEESLNLLRSSIPTSIEIRKNIPDEIDTILADSTQIHQVLINLCTNADHAMSDGGVIVVTLKNIQVDETTADQYPKLNPGPYVNLAVSDTGHGIFQEEIDRIFEPYFTTKEMGKGTGMGLAVVHGIVQGHNGLITVESELGKGTTFNIFFPVVGKEAIVERETVEELPTGDEKILFIDDEESIVKLGHQILERLGYKVKAMTSPIEALALFRAQPDKFDLVITDLTMPKMTGNKLVREILNIRPDIPIILCSGFSEKINEKKAKEIGAADFIEKPLDKRDFAVKIRKVLHGE